jgi:hypothetical protein
MKKVIYFKNKRIVCTTNGADILLSYTNKDNKTIQILSSEIDEVLKYKHYSTLLKGGYRFIKRDNLMKIECLEFSVKEWKHVYNNLTYHFSKELQYG